MKNKKRETFMIFLVIYLALILVGEALTLYKFSGLFLLKPEFKGWTRSKIFWGIAWYNRYILSILFLTIPATAAYILTLWSHSEIAEKLHKKLGFKKSTLP